MKKMSLTARILFAMVLGIVVGIILNLLAGNPIVDDILVGFLFKLVGKVFIAAIKMMVVPLVFVSLTCGAAQMGDVKKLGRIGTKTLGFYLLTTAIAITVAIVVALIIQPGSLMSMPAEFDYSATESPALVDVLIDIVPTNPIAAMAEGNMLQIIVFALLFGTALTVLGDKAKKVTEFFIEMNDVVIKMVTMIMAIAPYGVFCLVATTFAQLGFAAMGSLALYMFCVVLALVIHAIVTYQGLLYATTRLSPIQFFKNFYPAMAVAFSTASSSATLPVTLETVEKRLGVDKNIASFTLPLGATINMDGTAIMQGVATVFIAQLYGVNLGVGDFAMVIVTATLASIGTAGVPGVGLVMLSMVLVQVGLPVEAIGIILGIDRLLDMCRTAINITGDACCTVIIAKSEGAFDQDIYYTPNDLDE